MINYVRKDSLPVSPDAFQYVCGECYCTVEASQRDAHSMWHEKLRRAVDETGTLG
jgi:hypothetical protein